MKGESPKSKEDKVAGHLRGLKDVCELKLTPNPAFSRDGKASSSTEEDLPAPFMCPLSQREMNGKHRFVYLVPCGCVMSESGLRAVLSEQTDGTKESIASCPVCGTRFSTACLGKKEIQSGGDVVIINGTDAEVESLRSNMERRKEIESTRKKELKAKDLTLEESDEKRKKREEKRKRKEEIVKLLEIETKKAKSEDGNRSMPTKAGLVAVEAKGHALPAKEMSAAVRSIYGLDKPKQTGETWMTRGTFNRFA